MKEKRDPTLIKKHCPECHGLIDMRKNIHREDDAYRRVDHFILPHPKGDEPCPAGNHILEFWINRHTSIWYIDQEIEQCLRRVEVKLGTRPRIDLPLYLEELPPKLPDPECFPLADVPRGERFRQNHRNNL